MSSSWVKHEFSNLINIQPFSMINPPHDIVYQIFRVKSNVFVDYTSGLLAKISPHSCTFPAFWLEKKLEKRLCLTGTRGHPVKTTKIT